MLKKIVIVTLLINNQVNSMSYCHKLVKPAMVGAILTLGANDKLCKADEQRSVRSDSVFSKATGAIGSSEAVRKLNSRFPVPSFSSGEPVSEEYQALAKEAQDALGVPKQYQRAVKMLHPEISKEDNASARTTPDRIYINKDKIDSLSFGSKRAILFHEASHAKYNDTTTGFLVTAATFIVTCAVYNLLVAYINNDSLNKTKFTDSLGVSSVAAFLCMLDHRYVGERRADVEGYYATQCTDCITELVTDGEKSLIRECAEKGYDYAKIRIKKDNSGYLSLAEKSLIAQDLRRQNKYCAHHAKDSA